MTPENIANCLANFPTNSQTIFPTPRVHTIECIAWIAQESLHWFSVGPFRASWDENVLRSEVMEQLMDGAQIQRVLFNALPPQPARECRLIRGVQVFKKSPGEPPSTFSTTSVPDHGNDDVAGVAIVSTSVDHGLVVPEAPQELLPSAHFFRENLLVERIGREGEAGLVSCNLLHSGSASSSSPGCLVTIISEADIKWVRSNIVRYVGISQFFENYKQKGFYVF